MTTPVTNQTQAAATSGTANSTSGLAQLSNNFDTFLTLLTTQLKNQDPTAPMDSNQFTQQLVEFSQVEQQINTNTNLNTLITQGQSQIGTYATSYLGKSVSVTNGSAALSNGQANWTYTLATAASQALLTVSDANGKVVYAGTGGTAQGANPFNWNGQDNNGNATSRRHLHADRQRQGRGRLGRHQRRLQPGRGERDRYELGHAQAGGRRHGIGIERYRERHELILLNPWRPEAAPQTRRRRTKFKPAQGNEK